jgi:hypothetical protein
MTTEIQPETAIVPAQRTPIEMGPRGIEISTLAELGRFAQIVFESGLAPESLDNVQKIILALEMGLELGFRPMMALSNIGVINGRAGPFGDAAKALCERSGLMLDYKQHFEGTIADGTRKWIVESLRKGREEYLVTEYSITDAKIAELWGKMTKSGKPTPWVTAPDRMLMFRARGFNLRDNFPDVLKGFRTFEELEGMDAVDPADHTTRIKRAKAAKVTEPKFDQATPAAPAAAAASASSTPYPDPREETQPGLFAAKPKEEPKAKAAESAKPVELAQVKKLTPLVQLKTKLIEIGRTPEDFVALCVDREAITEPAPIDELEEELLRYACDHWAEVSQELAKFPK